MFFHILTDLFREGAFSGLDSLEWLKLEDNAISALPGGDLFPASLSYSESLLDLQQKLHLNPILKSHMFLLLVIFSL